MNDSLIVRSGKDKYKVLSADKYIINRNTPVGESPDYYEKKPYGGKKPIEPLAAITKTGKIFHIKYLAFNYEKGEWEPKNVPASLELYINSLK